VYAFGTAHEQLFAIDIESFALLIVGWKTHATVNLNEDLKGFHSSSVTVDEQLTKEKNG